jgi:hypothetical protein
VQWTFVDISLSSHALHSVNLPLTTLLSLITKKDKLKSITMDSAVLCACLLSCSLFWTIIKLSLWPIKIDFMKGFFKMQFSYSLLSSNVVIQKKTNFIFLKDHAIAMVITVIPGFRPRAKFKNTDNWPMKLWLIGSNCNADHSVS